MTPRLRPIRRHVLLLDDQGMQVENGVTVLRKWGTPYLDHLVVQVGTDEDLDVGPGDRVVLSDPNAGRRVMLDGTVYRLVRANDIVAKCEEA